MPAAATTGTKPASSDAERLRAVIASIQHEGHHGRLLDAFKELSPAEQVVGLYTLLLNGSVAVPLDED